MILYHGSNTSIEKVDLAKCRPFKDFGQGFYLTTMKNQAQKMAIRTSRIYGGKPCVNIYEFDESVLQTKNLNIRIFNEPTEEWALFVINNRNIKFKSPSDSTECNQDLKYDLVVGPVANDDLTLLFEQFSDGMIDLYTLTRGMIYKKLTDQYSFHTNKALKYLEKIGVLYD